MLVKMFPENRFTAEDIQKCLSLFPLFPISTHKMKLSIFLNNHCRTCFRNFSGRRN
ncbi:hypothetical protein D1BOALGB6SA_6748 [Olavius sp. associated proteobacterium Delta 1]|nr:hypothetical protein D1BOALGB6SA_6748 [Olavius sp. associated proteobacterium Delta 1]